MQAAGPAIPSAIPALINPPDSVMLCRTNVVGNRMAEGRKDEDLPDKDDAGADVKTASAAATTAPPKVSAEVDDDDDDVGEFTGEAKALKGNVACVTGVGADEKRTGPFSS